MTNTEICNKALGVLGHDRTIADYSSDNSTEAVRCRLFYPDARDAVLAAFAWEFATKSAAVLANTPYTLPGDCVRVIDVRDADGNAVYATRSGTSITAEKNAVMRYISNTATGGIESTMPRYVIDALVYELAARLAAPMLGNPVNGQDNVTLQQTYQQHAAQKLATAKALEIEEHQYLGAPADPETLAKTDISNRALSILGNARMITNFQNDPCKEALRCRQLMPMAIKHVLAQYTWEFALKDVTVANGSELPGDFVRTAGVYDANGDALVSRVTGNTIYLTGAEAAQLKYVCSSVQVSAMPPLIQEAIVYTLATAIASSVSDDKTDERDPNARTNKAQVVQTMSKHAANAIEQAVIAEKAEAMYRGTPVDECDLAMTDICNQVLSILGSATTIKDFKTDVTAEAVKFRSMLPIAVKSVLAAHDWDFAAVSMPYTAAAVSPLNWTRIARPPEAVRLVGAFDEEGHKLKSRQTRDFYEVLVPGAGYRFHLRYITMDINFSTTPVSVIEAIVFKLTALMVGTIMSDGKMVAQFDRDAQLKLMKAISEDSDETADHGEWENPFLKARGCDGAEHREFRIRR